MINEKTPAEYVKELQAKALTEAVLYAVDQKIDTRVNRVETCKEGTPAALSKDNWVRLSFKVNKKQLDQLLDFEKDMTKRLGVRFDKGYGGGWRDWNLDWSFEVD